MRHCSLKVRRHVAGSKGPCKLLCAGLLASAAGEQHADHHGEVVFDAGNSMASHWQGPNHRRAHITGLSPRGSGLGGNVTVLVSGAAFQDWGDVKCRFCSVEVRGHVLHSGAITCIAPPISEFRRRTGAPPLTASMSCRVDITLNGVDFTRDSPAGPFWYYNLSHIMVATLRPSGGGYEGGTLVTLTGTGFVDYGGGTQGLKCRFGPSVVPATVVSHQQARCITPPLAREARGDTNGSVPVWISLNGYTDDRGLGGGQVRFQYFLPAMLGELHPLGGPKVGGSLVTVAGDGFADYSEGSSPCPLDDPVLCEMHRTALGIQRSDVWIPGLSCVFEAKGQDPILVPASMQDAGHLTCRAPDGTALDALARPLGQWCAHVSPHCEDPAYSAHGAEGVAVRVTLNGYAADAASNWLVYMLYGDRSPRIDYVQPWGGPEAGGTHVSIVGEGLLAFSKNPMCRFGHVEVPAQVGGLNSSLALQELPLSTRVRLHHQRVIPSIEQQAGRIMTCTSPPGHSFGSRFIRLSVSLNGDHFASDALSWRYTDVIFSSIYPVGGPTHGGTSVIVQGQGFATLGGVRCVFGDLAVDASITTGGLRCLSPPVVSSRDVVVGVSINSNGLDSLLDASTLSQATPSSTNFSYFDRSLSIVSALTPASGPAFGATAITIHGSGLAEYGTVTCKFGKLPSERAASVVTSSVAVRGVDRVVCFSPPHTFDSLVRVHEQVSVEISLNGQPGASPAASVNFTYFRPCHGRDSMEFYDMSGGSNVLAHYLALNRPNRTQLDSDGDGKFNILEVARAVNASSAAGLEAAELSKALREYADATCDPLQ